MLARFVACYQYVIENIPKRKNSNSIKTGKFIFNHFSFVFIYVYKNRFLHTSNLIILCMYRVMENRGIIVWRTKKTTK